MGLNHLLARRKSSSSLRDKQSEAGSVTPSSTTPSDQKPREAKSAPYTRPSYTTVLATKGSFIDKSDLGITDASKSLCRILLEKEQTARIVQDITRLIVPSTETLATYSATHLDPLIESVNKGWNSAEPFYEKLKPFVGEVLDTFMSHFIATWQMYFPFLTCEVKCGAAALDVTDRQNAHSMTIAVRGIVELFKLVKREKELYQEILAFSISYNHRTVRIYGHYPIIDGNKTTFYRHPIYTFDFTALDGREKWTAYKICLVIDKLPPDLDIMSSQQSELEESGLLQGLESHNLSKRSNQDASSLLEEANSQSSRVGDVTPETSVS
ncbi:hypothetical protein B0J14DRAFT_620938 [Halenospora varia]|nr:hypothetical protein B0J14DRAFT_620938 [Halenospora varia]